MAGKLHTARSRNDQVATDLRLYVREAIDGLRAQITAVQGTLTDLAEEHLDTLLPGMTHLQHAQPVRLAHHFLAYFWMLDRDSERLGQARARMNVNCRLARGRWRERRFRLTAKELRNCWALTGSFRTAWTRSQIETLRLKPCRPWL